MTSGGNVIIGALITRRYMRSTNIPARMACATDLNLGFSSPLRLVQAICLVKVDASQSRTSCGTASGWTSESSSSSSAANRLKSAHKYARAHAHIHEIKTTNQTMTHIIVILHSNQTLSVKLMFYTKCRKYCSFSNRYMYYVWTTSTKKPRVLL